MIKISVFYPYSEGAAFNMDYYVNRHMPMVRDTIGAACKGIAVEEGVSGGAPGSRPTYVALGHIFLDSPASLALNTPRRACAAGDADARSSSLAAVLLAIFAFSSALP